MKLHRLCTVEMQGSLRLLVQREAHLPNPSLYYAGPVPCTGYAGWSTYLINSTVLSRTAAEVPPFTTTGKVHTVLPLRPCYLKDGKACWAWPVSWDFGYDYTEAVAAGLVQE